MRLHVLRFTDVFTRFDGPARGAFRAVIEPRKPRHRIVRALLAVVGLALLAVLAVAAIAIGTLVILVSIAWRMLRPRGGAVRAGAPRGGRVLDATYRVVPRAVLSR